MLFHISTLLHREAFLSIVGRLVQLDFDIASLVGVLCPDAVSVETHDLLPALSHANNDQA